MATYKSKPVSIGRPIEDVYARIADIAAYQKHIDALPDEARQKIGDVEFTEIGRASCRERVSSPV